MKDRDTIKWLYKVTKKQIPKIFFLSISNAILAIIGIALAIISKKIVDEAVTIANTPSEQDHGYSGLILFGLILLLTIVFRVVLRLVTQNVSVNVQAKMEMGMREKMFASVMGKEYSHISKYHSGEIMNRLTSDINIVSSGMTSILPDMTFVIFQFLGAMIVLMFFDWKFALVFAVGGIFIVAVVSFFKKKLKSLHKKVQETDGKARSFFQEAIESLIIIKTFSIEENMQDKGSNLQLDTYNAKMKRKRISIAANSGFSFVFNLGYVYALLWCSIKLCTKSMTYGTLTAVLQLISQVQTPFVSFTRIFPQLFGILASAERIMEIESIEAENIDRLSDDQIIDIYDKLDKIVFDDVKFSYGRDDVLIGGKADIEKGDFVMIRGISGIGKSTLMKMLMGVFEPTDGKILLGLSEGNVISAGPNTRNMFSYVPQGNYLFSGTIRENLCMANEDATEETIREALIASDSMSFLKKLPDGLETVIGEKGLGLSEGQVQRLAIARAVLSKAPIILLDESTSALDEETEKNVLNNIKSLKNRTCVIISHKSAALKVCNKEFIIEDKVLKQRKIS